MSLIPQGRIIINSPLSILAWQNVPNCLLIRFEDLSCRIFTIDWSTSLSCFGNGADFPKLCILFKR